MRNEINVRRTQISKRLKKNGCNYKLNVSDSLTYSGEGFYINSRIKAARVQRIWGYDKHWAYGGALKYKLFPLSNKVGEKETALGKYLISFKSIKKRLGNDFYYTLYLNNCEKMNDNRIYLRLTNLDYEIFTYLYEVEDLIIEKKTWYQDIGMLGIEDLIDQAYIDKKSGNYEKYIFEAAYYGLFAKKLWDYETPWERKKWKDAYDKFGTRNIRNEQVVIAMWQTAYLRYEEFELFKKYKDHVVYMNTDSIYCDCPIEMPEDKGVGYYGQCYNGEYIQFIRRNAYVILNDDMTIKERIIGGVADELNKPYVNEEGLRKLREGDSIIVKSYTDNKKREIIEVPLNPDFIQYLNGDCKSKKYIL